MTFLEVTLKYVAASFYGARFSLSDEALHFIINYDIIGCDVENKNGEETLTREELLELINQVQRQ